MFANVKYWITLVALLCIVLGPMTNRTSAITVELAKKCSALTAKAFPPRQVGNPAAGSVKGAAKDQRDYYNQCVANGGNTDDQAPASAQKETANRPDQADTLTIDAWTINENRSPNDGSPQVTATLNAVGYDARMLLRCEEKKTEAIFFVPSKLLGSREYVKVLLQLPGGVETMLSPSTNDQSFYAGSAEQFIRQLPDNGVIIISVSGYSGKVTSGEFKLGNFSVVRQKIAQACNWSSERAP